MATIITDSNIDKILSQDKLVVIDFWAEWCAPCRRLAPIIAELAEIYNEKVIIGKCDTEDGEQATQRFSVRNLPTIVFVKNGAEVDRIVGAVTKSKIQETIENHI